MHFWPETALVYGVRIDYLSPTLYFLDLLIVIYLFINKFESLTRLLRFVKHIRQGIWDFRLSPIVVVLITNLIFSINPLSTLSWSLHFILYLGFILTVPNNQVPSTVYYVLPISALFQLFLAVTQFYLGRSLQGPLYYLGERMVSVGQPGVALGSFMDQVVLRAYGTFGHPNVLSGWLVIVALIIHKLSKSRFAALLSHCTAILGIILTQSRSAALAYFGIIIPFYVLKKLQFRVLYFGVIFTMFISSWPLLVPDRADLSAAERINLQKLSLQVIQKNLVFGTGTNASISAYPEVDPSFRLLQPDHNSITLFLSWFGFFGVFAILYYFRLCFEFRISDFGFIIPILPLLFLDHYLLTSPQGLLILLTYLKVVNYSHAQSHR